MCTIRWCVVTIATAREYIFWGVGHVWYLNALQHNATGLPLLLKLVPHEKLERAPNVNINDHNWECSSYDLWPLCDLDLCVTRKSHVWAKTRWHADSNKCSITNISWKVLFLWTITLYNPITGDSQIRKLPLNMPLLNRRYHGYVHFLKLYIRYIRDPETCPVRMRPDV